MCLLVSYVMTEFCSASEMCIWPLLQHRMAFPDDLINIQLREVLPSY